MTKQEEIREGLIARHSAYLDTICIGYTRESIERKVDSDMTHLRSQGIVIKVKNAERVWEYWGWKREPAIYEEII